MGIIDVIIDPRLAAAIKIGKGLIDAGMEIFGMLKDKDKLSDEDLQAIISKENEAQKTARSELQKLLD